MGAGVRFRAGAETAAVTCSPVRVTVVALRLTVDGPGGTGAFLPGLAGLGAGGFPPRRRPAFVEQLHGEQVAGPAGPVVSGVVAALRWALPGWSCGCVVGSAWPASCLSQGYG
jgi:hypothetical protein